MANPLEPDPLQEDLLRHGSALRALAQRLVGGEDADDLVQDAALAALQQSARVRSPVAWMIAAVRKLAHKHHRTARRRAARQARAARPDSVPAADANLELEDSLRRLTGAVLSLPQPYRDVVLRRWLRDESPAAIAAARGVPIATVRSQLQRGLAILRTKLDAEGADWRTGFVVAFGIDTLRPAASTAALTMTTATTMKLGAAALVVVATAAGFAFWPDNTTDAAAPTPRLAASPTPATMAMPVADAATPSPPPTVAEAPAPRRNVADSAAADSSARLARELAALGQKQHDEIYRAMLQWFADDPAFAVQLATELYPALFTRSDDKRPAAVLAAWLDSGGEPRTVIAMALATIAETRTADGTPVEIIPSRRFFLGHGIRYLLADDDPLQLRRTMSIEGRERLLAAVVRAGLENGHSIARTSAVVYALEATRPGDELAIDLLLGCSRSPDVAVRATAVEVLGRIVSPSRLAAWCDRAPLVATTADDSAYEYALLRALVRATNREGGDRSLFQRRAAAVLRLPPSTERQEALQAQLLDTLLASADIAAMRDLLTELAERSPSARVRAAALAARDEPRRYADER